MENLDKKARVEEAFKNAGKVFARPCGFEMLVMVHEVDDKVEVEVPVQNSEPGIVSQDGTVVPYQKTKKEVLHKYETEAAYQLDTRNVGLVIAMGPDCYKGERYKDCEPYCEIGDWIMFPTHAGIRFRGGPGKIPCRTIHDDKCLLVVDDPSDIHTY